MDDHSNVCASHVLCKRRGKDEAQGSQQGAHIVLGCVRRRRREEARPSRVQLWVTAGNVVKRLVS